MPDERDTMKTAQQMLQEGRVQEAHDLLMAKLSEPPAEPPPPPPEAPRVVAAPIPDWVTEREATAGLISEFLPIFEALAAAAGNPPALEAKVNRLKSLHAGLVRLN